MATTRPKGRRQRHALLQSQLDNEDRPRMTDPVLPLLSSRNIEASATRHHAQTLDWLAVVALQRPPQGSVSINEMSSSDGFSIGLPNQIDDIVQATVSQNSHNVGPTNDPVSSIDFDRNSNYGSPKVRPAATSAREIPDRMWQDNSHLQNRHHPSRSTMDEGASLDLPEPRSRSPRSLDNHARGKLDLLQSETAVQRTKSWVRQALGQKAQTSSRLTSSVHAVCKQPRNSQASQLTRSLSPTSRVTTFSAETASEAIALNAAMKNMERLLQEAVDLANQAASAQTHPTDDTQRISIHSSPDPVQGSPTKYQPDAQYSGHSCHKLPTRSLVCRNIAVSKDHLGNIEGPALPERMSSLKTTPAPLPNYAVKRSIVTVPSSHSRVEPNGTFRSQLAHIPVSQARTQCILKDDSVAEPASWHLEKARYQNLSHPQMVKDDCEIQHAEADCVSGSGSWLFGAFDGSTSEDEFEMTRVIPIDQIQLPNHGPRQHHIHRHRKELPKTRCRNRGGSAGPRYISRPILRKRTHVSSQPGRSFELSRLPKRKPIPRDWPVMRKRFIAAIACLNTATIGLLAGIYAGLLPSIQYMVVDLNHSMVFGNVGFFMGLALVSLICWPLPLLHGRKPYTLCGLAVALPLLFPQAIVVSEPRSPTSPIWETAILVSRSLMGAVLGLTSMNCHATLTDLFGASLMSRTPHQETVDERDTRRHGGGLGVWLGLWTWCFVGSMAVGFLVGGLVIDNMKPSSGFCVCIGLTACVLVLNVLCPEVRRANWRHSIAEVKVGRTISKRLAFGEIMMHRVGKAPRWWGQELYHGVALSLEMLRQPGFGVMAIFAS